MRKILGIVMIACGVAFGLYIGVWFCFVGGIVDFVEAVRATELSTMALAFSIVKVMFASFCGYLSFAVLGIPGYTLLVMD